MARRKTKYPKNSDENKALEKINEWITLGSTHCEREHSRAEDNATFERGEQWMGGDAERQEQREKPALSLNSIHKLLNAVANREIMDRIVPKVFARGTEDQGVAELMDAASMWQRDLSETEHEESMAFRKMVGSGYGVMHKWFDPLAMEGDGMLRDQEVPIWNMIWDPMARAQNLVDRKWHMCGKYVDIEEANAVFGDVSDQAKSKFAFLKGRGKFDYDSEWDSGVHTPSPGGTWSQIRSGKWLSLTGKEVFVIEAEWKEIESYYRAAYPTKFDEYEQLVLNPDGVMILSDDPENPQQITHDEYLEMEPEDQMNFTDMILSQTEIRRFDSMKEFNPFLQRYEAVVGDAFDDYHKTHKEVIKYAIVIDNCILDLDTRPMGFTYEFLTGFCFETRDKIEFYGMIDVAKAPQDFKNVFYSNLLSLYMTSPKQHLLIEEGALKDVNAFLDEYAKLSGISIVPDGFVNGQRFLQLEPPRFPQMLESLVNIVDTNVQEIFGLSSIEMNTQGDLRRVSGNVVQAAKAASNTLLAILFDGLRRYRKRWGMLTIKSLMVYYAPDELQRIIGDSSQYLGVDYSAIELGSVWSDTVRFDVKIDESPTSITEQMQTVDFLTRTGTLEKWVDTGQLPFESALDLMVTIPKSVREKIKRDRNQQQQIQQQIQELQTQLEKQLQLHEAFMNFVQTQEGGGVLLAQFNLVNILAEQMAEQKHQQMMQQGAQ